MNNVTLTVILAAAVSFRKMVDEQTKECRNKAYRADDGYAKTRRSLLGSFEPMTDEAGIGFDNLDCAIEVVADRMTDGALDSVEREAWVHINNLILSPRLRVAYDKRIAARNTLRQVERGIYVSNRKFIEELVSKLDSVEVKKLAKELEEDKTPLTYFISHVIRDVQGVLAGKEVWL